MNQILNSGEEERRNDERSEELAKATNELASEEFLRSKNPTRTGKYIYKNAAFKDKKHFTIYCEARNVVPSLIILLILGSLFRKFHALENGQENSCFPSHLCS